MLKKIILSTSSWALLAFIPFWASNAQTTPAAPPAVPAAPAPSAAAPGTPAGARPIVSPVNTAGVPAAPVLPAASDGAEAPAGTANAGTVSATSGTCVGVNCAATMVAPPAVNPVIQPVTNAYVAPTSSFSPGFLLGPLGFSLVQISNSMYVPPNIANARNARELRDALDRYNDEKGFEYDPEFPEDEARRTGYDLYNLSTSAKGCQQFIDKDGRIGPWGRTALAKMKEYPEIFQEHVPMDMTRFCPAFPYMNRSERQLFWLWILASMADAESSCNPQAQSPYGALGLFQMDPAGCQVAGVYVTSRDLLAPHSSIRCAVARLAYEMKNRKTLLARHSRDKTGTYWAVLRGYSASAVDRSGAMKAMALYSKYSKCRMSPAELNESTPDVYDAPFEDGHVVQ